MTSREKLIAEIEAFRKRHDMKPTAFGLLAMNDGKFVGRLLDGKDVLLGTAERVRQFMADYEQIHGRGVSRQKKATSNRVAA